MMRPTTKQMFSRGTCRKELENTQLELQIRTAAMNARAEYGAASHAAYKSGMSDPGSVANLQALLESAEQEAAERYTMLSGDRLNLLPEGTEEGEIMDMQNQAAGGSDRCVLFACSRVFKEVWRSCSVLPWVLPQLNIAKLLDVNDGGKNAVSSEKSIDIQGHINP